MVRKISHVAIAVKSIDQAAKFFVGQLGLEIGGREHVPTNKVTAAFMEVGDSRVELVQPEGPDSPIAKFIEQRGPGLQHLCFEVDDIDAELRRLDQAGVQLINRTAVAGAHGCRVGFIHPKATGGVLIELSQPPPAGSHPGR